MRELKVLLAAVALLAASVAAAQYTRTVTIEVPKIAYWIDGSGNIIAPLVDIPVQSGSYDGLLVDASGNIWRVEGAATATPYLQEIAAVNGLYSTNSTCSDSFAWASVWAVGVPSFPRNVVLYGSGYYVLNDGAAIVTVTLPYLYYNGSCYASGPGSVQAYPWSAYSQVAKPTVPAGPWHIELR